jgi:hypothetical protein
LTETLSVSVLAEVTLVDPLSLAFIAKFIVTSRLKTVNF